MRISSDTRSVTDFPLSLMSTLFYCTISLFYCTNEARRNPASKAQRIRRRLPWIGTNCAKFLVRNLSLRVNFFYVLLTPLRIFVIAEAAVEYARPKPNLEQAIAPLLWHSTNMQQSTKLKRSFPNNNQVF